MPRSYSTYTASPTRYRSPQRSPVRRPTSEEGSQYELDLDALGVNSTFASTELEEKHAPKVDVVDTSDIEGPEDFTMNMTYWMTADLPLVQVKSRKEVSGRKEETRDDARQGVTNTQDTTEEGDRAVIEDTSRDRGVSEDFNSASPTMRANGTTDGHEERMASSESSMENDEKVMSYLSALPDTDLPGAITSTPLNLAKKNTLQVPNPAASKARSLQATVEDYDTPRKPTQDTVIHHVNETSAITNSISHDELQNQVADLQARLVQQELSSKTRITELETILAFTRSELETARTENYKHKEQIAGLRDENERHKQDEESNKIDVRTQIKEKERELGTRMQEFGEELRLQNLAKLQSQREDFERQMRATEEAKLAASERIAQKDQIVTQLRCELDQLRLSKEEQLHASKTTQQNLEQGSNKEHDDLEEKLFALQARAERLQTDLANATAEACSARQEAESAREEAHAACNLHLTSQSSNQSHVNRVSDLEARLRSLQSQLDSSRADASSKDQQMLRHIEDQEQLDQRLNTAKGRIEGLETTIFTLRQQLADAHRELSKARTDAERYEKDLEESKERLDDTKKEADRRVSDTEKKFSKIKELKADSESRFKILQSEHEAFVEDHETQVEQCRSNAEDAVRKVGTLLETERSEKRRIAKELKMANKELDKLRSEVAQKAAEEEESDAESSILSSHSSSKDVEIENLRTLLRKQASAMKTLKSETTSLRKKNQSSNHVHIELETLRHENDSLKFQVQSLKADSETQRIDFEAVNKAMDERLAAMLSKMLKERSKNVVGKRDEQWAASLDKLKGEREFMGKVLMREWGRQECGIAEEKENQLYRYQHIKRS